MALTEAQRKQILDAAYKAHREGKPLFPPKAKPDPCPEKPETLTPELRKRLIDAAKEAHVEGRPLFPPKAKTKPWLTKSWSQLTDTERTEFRAMDWADFKTDEERAQAMALQQQRLAQPSYD